MSTRARYGLIGAAVVLLVAVAGGIVWFVSDDAPPEVDLDTAASGVRDRTTTTGAGEPATSAAPGIDGTWLVDTGTGAFDFESATGSFVGFRVEEQLVNIGAATAVGRTGEVAGTMTVAGTQLTDASFEVDMTTITTNESRRDRRVQDALNTAANPTATFELSAPVELGDEARTGGPVEVDATGDLTINGTTRSVTIPLRARLVDGTIVVVGSMDVTFADYGVQVPSAPVVVSAEDHGVLELQLLFVRG